MTNIHNNIATTSNKNLSNQTNSKTMVSCNDKNHNENNSLVEENISRSNLSDEENNNHLTLTGIIKKSSKSTALTSGTSSTNIDTCQ